MESIQILSPYLYRGLIPSKKEKRKLGNGNRVLVHQPLSSCFQTHQPFKRSSWWRMELHKDNLRHLQAHESVCGLEVVSNRIRPQTSQMIHESTDRPVKRQKRLWKDEGLSVSQCEALEGACAKTVSRALVKRFGPVLKPYWQLTNWPLVRPLLFTNWLTVELSFVPLQPCG